MITIQIRIEEVRPGHMGVHLTTEPKDPTPDEIKEAMSIRGLLEFYGSHEALASNDGLIIHGGKKEIEAAIERVRRNPPRTDS